jgi:hypothetical protein
MTPTDHQSPTAEPRVVTADPGVQVEQEPVALSAKAESVLRIARSIGGPFTRADCGIPRDDRPDCVMAELQRAGLVERAEGLRDGWLLWRLTDVARLGPAVRQPRVWPQSVAPDDIADVLEVEGHGRFVLCIRRTMPPGGTTYVHEDDVDEHGVQSGLTWTLGRLRELGEVREVLS